MSNNTYKPMYKEFLTGGDIPCYDSQYEDLTQEDLDLLSSMDDLELLLQEEYEE